MQVVFVIFVMKSFQVRRTNKTGMMDQARRIDILCRDNQFQPQPGTKTSHNPLPESRHTQSFREKSLHP